MGILVLPQPQITEKSAGNRDCLGLFNPQTFIYAVAIHMLFMHINIFLIARDRVIMHFVFTARLKECKNANIDLHNHIHTLSETSCNSVNQILKNSKIAVNGLFAESGYFNYSR